MITARIRSDLGWHDQRKLLVFLRFWEMTARETPSFTQRDEINRNRYRLRRLAKPT